MNTITGYDRVNGPTILTGYEWRISRDNGQTWQVLPEHAQSLQLEIKPDHVGALIQIRAVFKEIEVVRT